MNLRFVRASLSKRQRWWSFPWHRASSVRRNRRHGDRICLAVAKLSLGARNRVRRIEGGWKEAAKEKKAEARSGGSHPLLALYSPSSGLVTTSGWYVEPKPFVSSWLASLSLSLPLFLSPPPIIHGNLALVGSSSPLWPSRLLRPVWLSRILFPWFTRAPLERENYLFASPALSPLLAVLSRCRNLPRFRTGNRVAFGLGAIIFHDRPR